MNKIDFKDLDKEQMVIAFNQLKDDYQTLFERKEQLEEVIEEVREVVKELELHYQQSPTMIPSTKLKKLLQILDKVKER